MHHKKETIMRIFLPAALLAAALALSGCGQTSAVTQADPQQQAASDWYSQHQGNLPEGLRPEDQLSADQQSRLKVGVVMDNDIRDRAHPAPPDLANRLTPPPPDHQYVAVGGQVGLVDKNYQVKALIQVHK
jgi:hypothetical protein